MCVCVCSLMQSEQFIIALFLDNGREPKCEEKPTSRRACTRIPPLTVSVKPVSHTRCRRCDPYMNKTRFANGKSPLISLFTAATNVYVHDTQTLRHTIYLAMINASQDSQATPNRLVMRLRSKLVLPGNVVDWPVPGSAAKPK